MSLGHLQEGLERAEVGMSRALDHADRAVPDWKERATGFARGYIFAMKRDEVFTAEDLIVAARGHVPDPPDGRAWGGIIRSFACGGFIVRHGFRFSENAAHHGAPKTVWRVNV